MGNRAIIKGKNSDLGLYVHWNGGYDSVYPILQYCKLKGYRGMDADSYGLARLCQVYANFFGGTNSVGIEKVERNMTACIVEGYGLDNGVYEVDNDWNIVTHWNYSGREVVRKVIDAPISDSELKESLLFIDRQMPEHDRLGADFLMADVVPVSDIKIGDKVFVETLGGCELRTVEGYGKDEYVNGTHILNVPYVDLYSHKNDFTGENDYSWNINNYIRTETVRRKHIADEELAKEIADELWTKMKGE